MHALWKSSGKLQRGLQKISENHSFMACNKSSIVVRQAVYKFLCSCVSHIVSQSLLPLGANSECCLTSWDHGFGTFWLSHHLSKPIHKNENWCDKASKQRREEETQETLLFLRFSIQFQNIYTYLSVVTDEQDLYVTGKQALLCLCLYPRSH